MNRLILFLAVALTAAVSARAADETLINLANDLAAKASAAVDAAVPGDDMQDPPPWFKNRSLRGDLKDIRKIAFEFRDRAAKDKARGLVGKLKVKRMVRNMKTCNFLVANGAARNLADFAPAYAAVREGIAAIVSEMCCGGAE